jgi:hypothetical protein
MSKARKRNIAIWCGVAGVIALLIFQPWARVWADQLLTIGGVIVLFGVPILALCLEKN